MGVVWWVIGMVMVSASLYFSGIYKEIEKGLEEASVDKVFLYFLCLLGPLLFVMVSFIWPFAVLSIWLVWYFDNKNGGS